MVTVVRWIMVRAIILSVTRGLAEMVRDLMLAVLTAEIVAMVVVVVARWVRGVRVIDGATILTVAGSRWVVCVAVVIEIVIGTVIAGCRAGPAAFLLQRRSLRGRLREWWSCITGVMGF